MARESFWDWVDEQPSPQVISEKMKTQRLPEAYSPKSSPMHSEVRIVTTRGTRGDDHGHCSNITQIPGTALSLLVRFLTPSCLTVCCHYK